MDIFQEEYSTSISLQKEREKKCTDIFIEQLGEDAYKHLKRWNRQIEIPARLVVLSYPHTDTVKIVYNIKTHKYSRYQTGVRDYIITRGIRADLGTAQTVAEYVKNELISKRYFGSKITKANILKVELMYITFMTPTLLVVLYIMFYVFNY